MNNCINFVNFVFIELLCNDHETVVLQGTLEAFVSYVSFLKTCFYYIRQVNGVNGEIYCDAFFLLSVCL